MRVDGPSVNRSGLEPLRDLDVRGEDRVKVE